MGDKNGQSPESKFYDTVKGKRVVVQLKISETVFASGAAPYLRPTSFEGKLVYVDVYSIGLEVEGGTMLILKGAMATLKAARHDRS